MKKSRKLISLVLVFVMLLSMAATAFAATSTRDESGYTFNPVPGTTPDVPVTGNQGTQGDNPGNPTQGNTQGNTQASAGRLLNSDWTLSEQNYRLANPAPWNVFELKQVVDVTDPRSVAAYWVWSVYRLTQNYDDAMGMMKYLFADIEPFGSGFTEGGMSGRAGWDTYFNDRLTDPDYLWLPRAFFDLNYYGSNQGLTLLQPLEIRLLYNKANTESFNAQSYESLGRLNIVYTIENRMVTPYYQVNINLSKFAGSDRWYVTNGASSSLMFKQLTSEFIAQWIDAIKYRSDDGTSLEAHTRRYGTVEAPMQKHEHKYVWNRKASMHWQECEICGEKLDVWDVHHYDTYELYRDGHFLHCQCGDNLFQRHYYEDKHYYDMEVNDGLTCVTCGKTKAEHDLMPCVKCGKTNVELSSLPGFLDDEYEELAQSVENKFTDVKEDDYYFDAVQWAVKNEVTSGTTETTFSPDVLLDRAQMVTFLWKAAGKPEPTQTDNPFEDVSERDWYYKSILWAVGQGIINGTSATSFSPKGECSSAMVVTMLYRVNGGPLKTQGAWYQEAKDWALANGFASGTGLEINPDEACPRGAIVTFLFRNDQGI